MVYAIDLEGVLAPEIWPLLGARFGVPELSLTTRESANFDALMTTRIEATRRHGLTLAQLQATAHAIEPYLGAREFLSRVRGLGQVILISDTFHELAEPLAQKLGGHSLFANRFEVGPDGLLSGFRLRIRGQKDRIVSGIRSAGYKVAAMGDSLNDLTILEACDFPVLFRPVAALLERFPAAAVATNLDEALAHFETAHRQLDAR